MGWDWTGNSQNNKINQSISIWNSNLENAKLKQNIILYLRYIPRSLGISNVTRDMGKWRHLYFISESINYSNLLKVRNGDFSGGPVAKTLCCQWRGHGFDPWSGNYIPHAATKTQCSQKKKKKSTKCAVRV